MPPRAGCSVAACACALSESHCLKLYFLHMNIFCYQFITDLCSILTLFCYVYTFLCSIFVTLCKVGSSFFRRSKEIELKNYLITIIAFGGVFGGNVGRCTSMSDSTDCTTASIENYVIYFMNISLNTRLYFLLGK